MTEMTPQRYDDKGPMTTEDIAVTGSQNEETETAGTQRHSGAMDQPWMTSDATAETTPDARQERAVFPGEATGERTDVDSGQAATPPEDTTAQGEAADRGAAGQEGEEPLLPSAQAQELRTRWQQVQTCFVDDPREAVRTADELVADLMRRLAESFADRKQRLESQWNRGDSADTEELRLALQKYRSFFDRLLSS
ncbi:hypothetical protein [Streptomyces sp. LS1784]|uniref:hypothetical protein n=1 Tax=Streptomyces sp. LS1784 TaxID=2851533 RepID=UPI001CCC3C95|nr:hypothetical protein [Streptomyces sp. LS1784]